MNKETMTSRQRVLKAINHEKPDRIPIDLGMHFSTGISAFAYWNLREYLNLPNNAIELIDCVQLLARVEEDMLNRFHVDTVLLNPHWPSSHVWNPRGQYQFFVPDRFQPIKQPDGSYAISIGNNSMYMPAGGFFFDGAWPDFYGLSEEDKLDLYAKRAEINVNKKYQETTSSLGISY